MLKVPLRVLRHFWKAESVLRLSSESVLRLFRVWNLENRQIPIWDGNWNDFKPIGILTCGFCGFPWDFL